MENGVTDRKKKPSASPITYSDIFNEAFPYYLAIGMPADEYWEGASDLVIGYRKAFKIRMENEENHWERINDHAAWLTGIYIRHAFQSIAVFVNGFMPKGVKLTDYPEKPFTLQAEEKADAEKKRKAEEEQQKLAMAMFQATIMRFNKRFEGKAKAD